MVVYEYRNTDQLGVNVSSSDGISQKKFICDDSAISNNLCSSEQQGKFIVNNNTGHASYAPIYTTKIDLKQPGSIHYPINKTGYYCVSTYLSKASSEFTAAVVFQNAFGQLPASQIPKLMFYGFAALAYGLVLTAWMFAYYQNRSDILKVQHYISAICGFLVIEMLIIWGYYDYTNVHGNNTGSKVYLVILSILNSVRISFTFFLLLIVCMGYGVVRLSLGSTMWKCRALAAMHFMFAVGWTITSYVVPPDNTSPLMLFVIAPLALTMTAFYVWILTSLSTTHKKLMEERQFVKAQMYTNLWRILFVSILVIFIFFFINAIVLSNESNVDYFTSVWQFRWFLVDGWLNVIYFVDFCLIAYIWRPTANNKRFAMSSQLAQDENDIQDYELGSLRGMSDDEDQLEYESDGSIPSISDFEINSDDENLPINSKKDENLANTGSSSNL